VCSRWSRVGDNLNVSVFCIPFCVVNFVFSSGDRTFVLCLVETNVTFISSVALAVSPIVFDMLLSACGEGSCFVMGVRCDEGRMDFHSLGSYCVSEVLGDDVLKWPAMFNMYRYAPYFKAYVDYFDIYCNGG
jgi:hypothetical protein